MFASLLRPKRKRILGDRSPFSSPYATIQTSPERTRVRRDPRDAGYDESTRSSADLDQLHLDGDDELEDEDEDEDGRRRDVDEHDDGPEDGPEDSTPLLPIFSAPYLDAMPVYNLTHVLRILIASRCETTLSWDQLRSPQVSQFLLKPIQQEIIESHFSRATLWALMANCLQFMKEVDTNPGISGASKTRAMVCELLAIKLLKEYSTRELIDALSYDFYPLQGQTPPATGTTLRGPGWEPSQKGKTPARAARISCLEIAIRAQAKRLLAHPVVVQQLEAIWAGTIVFHSAADNMHRQPSNSRAAFRGYGTVKIANPPSNPAPVTLRRSVTLYNPRDASLFKLSRLRVPRYRQFLSTCSLAVLLGLFLAVLMTRSLEITSLELIFWLWSAGFMLDEIVGFNEQGFSLYLMSFWNTFDLGILLLLVCYYCLRLCGVFMGDDRRHTIANIAYDVLAANAVLLFPRLFSVLDHYRYFSQLLIAFRMMAADLIAVFILIIIACSGFFVAFSFSFGSDGSPSSIAYALFQMLMGFTPAAWSLWDEYNTLGRIILTLFLFICHFLVVTILITVLTNSFMAIVQNANEEHQFVFAVNAISMVKSDALFSYVAPTNILAWLVTPFRYFLPFRQFIRLNRTMIKITHFPILFTICLYERTILRSSVFDPTDLVELPSRRGNGETGVGRRSRLSAFRRSPRPMGREPSIATHHQDRALEEVFRRPLRDATFRQRNQVQSQTSHVVNNWMQGMGPDPMANPPDEQDPEVVQRLENRRAGRSRIPLHRRNPTGTLRNFTETTRSVASDPEDFVNADFLGPSQLLARAPPSPSRTRQISQQTDMEGDDELTSSDNEDESEHTMRRQSTDGSDHQNSHATTSFDQSQQPNSNRYHNSRPSTANLISRKNSPSRRPKTPKRHHMRTISNTTMLYKPVGSDTGSDSKSSVSIARKGKSGAATPISPGHRTPKRNLAMPLRTRPIMPPRSQFMSAQNFGARSLQPNDARNRRSLHLDLGSDIGDNKAIGGGFLGVVPSTLATEMYATGGLRQPPRRHSDDDDQGMLSKLVLARMNTLEEGFREVIKEVRDMRRENGSRSQSRGADNVLARGRKIRANPLPTSRRKVRERDSGTDTSGGESMQAKSEEAWVDDTYLGYQPDHVEEVRGSSV